VRALALQRGGGQRHPPRRPPRCLSMAGREEISRGIAAGPSCRQIAARLERAPSTVSRELAKMAADPGLGPRPPPPPRSVGPSGPTGQAGDRAAVGGGGGGQAGAAMVARAARGVAAVGLSFRSGAGVSRETIDLSLFVQSRGGLGRELQRCLGTGWAMRSPQGKRLPQAAGELRDVVLSGERPAEAADRGSAWPLGRRPAGGQAALGGGDAVERASRSLTLVALPDGAKAEQVRPALAAVVARLPEQLRRSLTWDQGKEMAEHTRFTVDTGVQVYFCDPRSPSQRGSNKNTNGLLGQYLPRGADLRQLDQAALDAIAAELNGRPRQTLGFKTPSQALAEAMPRPPETATDSGTPAPAGG
jgi:hypothetical protein